MINKIKLLILKKPYFFLYLSLLFPIPLIFLSIFYLSTKNIFFIFLLSQIYYVLIFYFFNYGKQLKNSNKLRSPFEVIKRLHTTSNKPQWDKYGKDCHHLIGVEVGVWEGLQHDWASTGVTWNTYDDTNIWNSSGASGSERGQLLDSQFIGSSSSMGDSFSWNVTAATQNSLRDRYHSFDRKINNTCWLKRHFSSLIQLFRYGPVIEFLSIALRSIVSSKTQR